MPLLEAQCKTMIMTGGKTACETTSHIRSLIICELRLVLDILVGLGKWMCDDDQTTIADHSAPQLDWHSARPPNFQRIPAQAANSLFGALWGVPARKTLDLSCSFHSAPLRVVARCGSPMLNW